MTLKANVLYYFRDGDREYKRCVQILDKLHIPYIPIKIHDRMLDETFIKIMLEFCENGFEDLLKNPKRMNIQLDFDKLTTNELISIIVRERDNVLKNVWFLGLSGGNGVVTSTMTEDAFTIYIPFKEREMSKIYE